MIHDRHTVNLTPLIFIVCIVASDLLLRFFIFGRLESVGIDIALFSVIYCVVEIIREYSFSHDNFDKTGLGWWLIKLAVTFIALVIMGIFHKIAENELNDTLNDVLKKVKDVSSVVNIDVLLGSALPLLKRSILVSFTAPEGIMRAGKRHWRTEVSEFVNVLAKLEGEKRIKQQDFALSRNLRYAGLAIFAVFGASCVVVVGWPS